MSHDKIPPYTLQAHIACQYMPMNKPLGVSDYV